MSTIDSTKYRVCKGCGLRWPLDERLFRRHPRGRDGFYGKCRGCVRVDKRSSTKRSLEKERARKKRWREENADKVARQDRERYEQNREAWAEYGRRRRETKPEEVAAYQREYREKNRERLLANNRAWRAKNKERLRPQQRQHGRNRWAREAGAAGSHTAEEVARMYADQGGLCAYCEAALDGNYNVDHMLPLSRGGSNSWENLAITCESCNKTKHTKTPEEFMERAKLRDGNRKPRMIGLADKTPRELEEGCKEAR